MPFPSVELAAYITPPDPNPETMIVPTLYVLSAKGSEKRDPKAGGSMPRNTGPGTGSGNKTIRHNLQLHVLWFLATANPLAGNTADNDLLFSGVIETVMAALRTNTPDPVLITDPWTGIQTWLVDTGENMSYDYLPRHSVKSQKLLRYDALIDLPLVEEISA